MVSFEQLRKADLKPLSDAVQVWTNLVSKLENAEDDYRDKLLKPLRDSKWQGKDSDAAFSKLVPVQRKIRVAATEASAVASVIHSGHAQFKTAQDNLNAAISTAQALYMTVVANGRLIPPDQLPQGYDAKSYEGAMKLVQARFASALREATDADESIAQALGQLDANVLDSPNAAVDAAADARMATRIAGFGLSNIPPENVKGPQQVADWWKGLPEEQRHLLMSAYPQRIGWLDGLPAEDRDEANRTRLANDLAAAKEHAEGAGPDHDRFQDEEKRLQKLQTFLDQADTTAQPNKEKYLLGLDSAPGNDGKVIVATGNPDTAKHTAVMVPGTGTDLDGIGGNLRRAESLHEATLNASNGEPVSTITWLGYDAPDDLAEAAFRGAADEGGKKLDGFVDGLRVTGGKDEHITAIGHSYGSVVVGEGAKDGNGMQVNDIIVAGSPGMHVGHANDLNVGANHVWSLQATADPVPAAGAPFHGDAQPRIDFNPLRGQPPSLDVDFVTPTDREFGANRMTTDTVGHSDYWNEGTTDLKNQAKVVAGRYHDKIGLLWGKPPQ